MTDHFTLDVDPAGLRSAATEISRLREHLVTKGVAARGVPDEIGEGWTGDAATAMKSEMVALGHRMSSFSTQLDASGDALTTLATTYQDALDQLPGLNRRWEAADEAYDDAVGRAATHRDNQAQDLREQGTTINRTILMDLQDAQNHAVTSASQTRASTQRGLDTEFAHLEQHLAQETTKMSSALRENAPISVTDDQIEQWRHGQAPELDRSGLMVGFTQIVRRTEQLARDEARALVDSQLEDLNDALEDGDQDAVEDALEAIGANADDPIYTSELVDALGPDGVQDLYLQIDQGLKDSDLDLETLWPSLQGFNDAIAHGISQQSDDDYAGFVEDFMDEDYVPKMWALIAASDRADGRTNAVALAYQSEVYNGALNDGGLSMPGLYPQAFNYAYGDEDMLDQWDDRSSGDDLADVLEHASPKHVDDLIFRLMNVQTDGGTMNDDDYGHIADLFGELLLSLRDRHLNALEASDGARPDLLLKVLAKRYGSGSHPGYFDPIRPYLRQLVEDPEWALWYLDNARDGFVDPSLFKDLIDESGSDAGDLVARMTTYQIQRGDDPGQVATNLGLMLRYKDLLGDDIKWDGVVKSLAESAINAVAGSNPMTGPVKGALNALLSEVQRLEAKDKALNNAMGKNAIEEVLAFSVYTQSHGRPPPGFDEYVAQQGLQDDERAINFYMQHLEQQGGPVWNELQNLTTLIDESRDEE